MRTVFKNAKIFTGVPGNESDSFQHNSLVINDNIIEHVGIETDEAVAAAVENGARVYDVGAQTISPGFFDGHMHLLMFGTSLQKVSLEHCKSLQDIRSTIREAAKKDQSRPRILCRGWMHYMTDGQALASDLDDLDEVKRPIYIDSKDLHSTWVSSSAIKELGVENVADPAGGRFTGTKKGKRRDFSAKLLLSRSYGHTWPRLHPWKRSKVPFVRR